VSIHLAVEVDICRVGELRRIDVRPRDEHRDDRAGLYRASRLVVRRIRLEASAGRAPALETPSRRSAGSTDRTPEDPVAR